MYTHGAGNYAAPMPIRPKYAHTKAPVKQARHRLGFLNHYTSLRVPERP